MGSIQDYEPLLGIIFSIPSWDKRGAFTPMHTFLFPPLMQSNPLTPPPILSHVYQKPLHASPPVVPVPAICLCSVYLLLLILFLWFYYRLFDSFRSKIPLAQSLNSLRFLLTQNEMQMHLLKNVVLLHNRPLFWPKTKTPGLYVCRRMEKRKKIQMDFI